jgi:hypothetical protein
MVKERLRFVPRVVMVVVVDLLSLLLRLVSSGSDLSFYDFMVVV